MRMRYSELIGKTVLDVDGARIGRIRDLFAERRGNALRVTSILIGEGALLQRITFRMRKRRKHIQTLRPRVVPWTLVDRIEGHIVRLRVTKAQAVTYEPPPGDNREASGTRPASQGGAT